jgi:hypothetical protein
MPATYEPISTQTVSGTSSAVTFSSISGSYTDLVVVVSVNATSGSPITRIRFNGDTGTNYSWTALNGNGSAAQSTRASSEAQGYLCSYSTIPTAASTFSTMIASIHNYSNSTTYKTCISRASTQGAPTYNGAEAVVSLWRNTAAITSIEIAPTSSTFVTGSTFTLYGVKAAA